MVIEALSGYTLEDCYSKNVWNIHVKFKHDIFKGIVCRNMQKTAN